MKQKLFFILLLTFPILGAAQQSAKFSIPLVRVIWSDQDLEGTDPSQGDIEDFKGIYATFDSTKIILASSSSIVITLGAKDKQQSGFCRYVYPNAFYKKLTDSPIPCTVKVQYMSGNFINIDVKYKRGTHQLHYIWSTGTLPLERRCK